MTLSGSGETPGTAPIGVFISRFTPNLPDDYGAHIVFNAGERVRIVSVRGRPDAFGTLVDGEMKWHDTAPLIDSARGQGRWIYEVVLNGEAAPCAIPASQFKLAPPTGASPNDR